MTYDVFRRQPVRQCAADSNIRTSKKASNNNALSSLMLVMRLEGFLTIFEAIRVATRGGPRIWRQGVFLLLLFDGLCKGVRARLLNNTVLLTLLQVVLSIVVLCSRLCFTIE